MLVVKILGGFASQLEKYIIAYQISNSLNIELVLDVSEYVSGYFRPFVLHYLCLPDCRLIDGVQNINGLNYISNGEELITAYDNKAENIYIYKEKQDYYSFFKKYPEFEINSDWKVFNYVRLQFRSDYIDEFIKRISNNFSVAVHIRRGDFVTIGWDNSVDDFKSIIGHIFSIHKNSVFYFFSNDIDWVKDNFGDYEQFVFVNHENGEIGDLEDFFCMSVCNQRILSSVSGYGKYADILSHHNLNKEKAYVTKVNSPKQGLLNPNDFQNEQYVQVMNKTEMEKGLKQYNLYFKNGNKSTINHYKENKIVSNVTNDNVSKCKIVLIDGGLHNPWIINDFQCLANMLNKSGYDVYYIQFDNNYKKPGVIDEAKDMDGNHLGYKKMILSNINNWYDVQNKLFLDDLLSKNMFLISNCRIITNYNYIYINNKNRKNKIRYLVSILKKLKIDKKALIIDDYINFKNRLPNVKKLHDVKSSSDLTYGRNIIVNRIKDKCINNINDLITNNLNNSKRE